MSQPAVVRTPVRTLSGLLKERGIPNFFSRKAFQKARAYQAERRVLGLEISDDLTHIEASVRGSERSPYRVVVDLDFHGDRLADIDSECSCPIGFDCKHVAAVLLEALNGSDRPAGATLS